MKQELGNQAEKATVRSDMASAEAEVFPKALTFLPQAGCSEALLSVQSAAHMPSLLGFG